MSRFGRRVFQIHLAVNGRFIKTVEATADVAALVDVVVPVRSIKADEEIAADDVATERIVLYDLKQPFAINPADVIGKSRHPSVAATECDPAHFGPTPFAVHKGDRVTIEARQEGFRFKPWESPSRTASWARPSLFPMSIPGKSCGRRSSPGVVRVSF